MGEGKVLAGVALGKNCLTQEYCIVGVPPRGAREGALETCIGDDAVLRSHSVIYAGNRIGARFQCGHGVMIRELNEIGDDVSVGSHSNVEHHVKIARGVRIHSGVFIPEYTEIKENAWIGPHVAFTNVRYPASVRAKEFLHGAVVEKNARIGANATILPGVRIGEGALVGAGSVVTHDVPAGAVVAGNPARVIKSVASLEYPDGSGKAYPARASKK